MGTAGEILTTPDGVNWTQQASGTTNWLLGVTYGGGQYVVVGDAGTVLTSGDGKTWTNVGQSATKARLNNVAYGGGHFVAVGEGGAVISSSDGKAWTLGNSGLNGWLRAVAYLQEYYYNAGFPPLLQTITARFVAAGQGGTIITSYDGISWATDPLSYPDQQTSAGGDIEAFMPREVYNEAGVFADELGVGSAGLAFNCSWYQWSTVSGLANPREVEATFAVSSPIELRGVAQGGGRIFAAGDAGTVVASTEAYYQSEGGPLEGWSQLHSETSANLRAAAAIGDAVFIVGDDETILEYTPSVDSRLANISCRARVGSNAANLIAGFVIGGSGTSGSLPVLIRASGPALAAFGITDFLPDPYLRLYWRGADSAYVTGNAGWGGGSLLDSEADEVGAFPWPSYSSLDSALALSLSPGPYTATIEATKGDTGVALAEVYDALAHDQVTATSSRLVNLSARATVGGGGDALIAGFVITGTSAKTVLIRASGPSLAKLGVTNALPDPHLEVFNTANATFDAAVGLTWSGDQRVATAASWVGAFSWGSAPSLDSAVLVTLDPGAYTANVTSLGANSGVALIEVYEVQ